MTEQSIADDVVFVPLCGENQGWAICSDGLPRIPPGLDAGVAGAYLVELAIARSIEIQAEQVIATPRKPPADADLAAVLRQIAAERPRSVCWWIKRLAERKPHLRQLARLRARGLVSEYDQPVWGLFGKRNSRRCFAPDWGAEEGVMRRLGAELRDQPTDERTKGLLAILCAGGWTDWFIKDDAVGRRHAKRAVASHWIGPEVAHVVLTETIYVIT
jgi:hypothetical protein